MATGSSVQFFGAESVLQAYRSRGINAWAVFQGKNLLTTGEDETTLRTWLGMLESSNGIYSLKVYNVDSAEDIDELTPANGSFNFKLLGNPVTSTAINGASVNMQPQGIAGLIQKKMEAKIGAQLDKWFDKIDLDADEDEDEPETLQSIGMALLKEPAKIPQLLDGVKAILGILGGANAHPQPQYQPQPAYYPQVPFPQAPPAAISGAVTIEERYNRIGAAIETIEKCDPEIMEHLEKLADLSVKQPDKFKNLISMLSLL